MSLTALLAVAGIVAVLFYSKQLGAALANINSGLVSGAVTPIVNAWVEVTIIGGVLGFILYYAQAKTNEKLGIKNESAPLEGFGHVAPAPSFGTKTGLSGGPFTSGATGGFGRRKHFRATRRAA